MISRADYPTAGNSTTQPADESVRPTQLTVVSIDTASGKVTSLNALLPQPMADVPVSDGTWLAALDDAGMVWLANLDGVPQPASSALSALSLIKLSYPWLIASDATGSFLYDFVAHHRINLAASVHPDAVALNAPHVAYLQSQSDTGVDIHLTDLASGQDAIVDTVTGAQLFLYSGELQYVTLDTEQQAYFVWRFDASKGTSSIAVRVKSVPNPGETQSIIDVGSRGYLMQYRFRNESNILIEQLDILHTSGDRDLLTVYGAIDQTGVTALNQPRFAGEHLVYRDPVDGFWIVVDLETGGSRRINPFREVGAP